MEHTAWKVDDPYGFEEIRHKFFGSYVGHVREITKEEHDEFNNQIRQAIELSGFPCRTSGERSDPSEYIGGSSILHYKSTKRQKDKSV